MGKTFTAQELRERVLALKDAYPAATIDVHELLDDLGIKLEPDKLEVEGYIWSYGENAITMDGEGGMGIQIPYLLSKEFGSWGGQKVKLTIEEVLD